jgi:hypothetical protein
MKTVMSMRKCQSQSQRLTKSLAQIAETKGALLAMEMVIVVHAALAPMSLTKCTALWTTFAIKCATSKKSKRTKVLALVMSKAS